MKTIAGIIIPFRHQEKCNRWDQLRINTVNISRLCNKHHRNYKIYVIIQDDDRLFNRGTLINAGVDIAKDECDYFIIHDVDNIVVDDSDAYRNREFSGNICGVIDGKKYSDKDNHFSDIVFFKKEDYFAINGISNWYWGWGWEISATPQRMKNKGIPYRRGDAVVKTIPHDTSQRHKGNPNLCNNFLIYSFLDTELMEGYNELEYSTNKVEVKDGNRVDYYVTFPNPPYKVPQTMTIEQIRSLGGNPPREVYDYIVKNYQS